MCEHLCFFAVHQLGEHATYPIARFLSRSALLLLLAWNGHAAFVTPSRTAQKTHTRARPIAVSRIIEIQSHEPPSLHGVCPHIDEHGLDG
jgi:hypothetical protein